MRRLYSLCIYLLAPLAFAAVLWRGLGNRGYWQGLGERFGFGAPTARAPCIWLHAVSLGEVSAAAALLRALQARHPGTPVTLTTATPTGRTRARTLFGTSVDVRFLPYDTPGSVRRFLQRIRPRLAIIIDDCGQWPDTERAFVALPFPLTLSVLPHVRFGSVIARDASVAGKGVMLHLPMETLSGLNPGPGKVTTEMGDAAIAAQVEGSGMAEKLLRLSLKKSSPALFNMKPPTKDDKPVPGSISNKFNTELAVPLPKLPSVGVDPLLK